MHFFLINYIVVLHVVFLLLFAFGVHSFYRDYVRGTNGITLAMLYICLALLAGEVWSVFILLNDESELIRVGLRAGQLTLFAAAWTNLLCVHRKLNRTPKNGKNNQPENKKQSDS